MMLLANQSKTVTSIADNCLKFGTPIGSYNNIVSYCNYDGLSWDSNYVPNKKDNNRPLFSGMKWQCVEYARRYLIQCLDVYFEDVDCAYNIYEKDIVYSIDNKITFPFVSYDNVNKCQPYKNDVLIFEKSLYAPYGHVAIITEVNIDKEYVEICEQNYNNKWENPTKYSRRIRLTRNYQGDYTLIDDASNSKYNHIIGWKRVEKA